MKPYVRIVASREKTRVVVMLGMSEALRASLPPLWQVTHHRAVVTLLELLSLWADGRACVALSADDAESCFRLGLTDGLGVGTRGVFHAVEVVSPGRHRGGRRATAAERRASQLQLVPRGER